MDAGRLKPVAWGAGAAAIVAALWFAVPLGLGQLDFFLVRRIELVGVRYLPADAVLNALAAPDSSNLFSDWSAARRRILDLPGVTGVKVDRRLPGTLRLVIEETVPVALGPEEDRMVLVAPDGVVLPFDPAASAPDLPVLLAVDSAAAALLARMKVLVPDVYERISTVNPIDGDVLLTLERSKLWLRSDASATVLLSVAAVERDLNRRGESYAELDGRYADQVVVRRRPA